MSAPPRQRSSDSPASTKEFSALESRLFQYLDTNLKEIKDAISQQGANIQQLSVNSASRSEVKELERGFEALHTQSGLLDQRVRAIELERTADDRDKRAKENARGPFTWQVVVGSAAILSVLISLAFDVFLVVVQVITVGLSLYAVLHH